MKAGIRIGGVGLLAAGLLAGQAFTAVAKEKGPAKEQKQQREKVCKPDGEGDGEGKHEQARKQHMEEMKTHMQAQREAGREFMKSVMDEKDAQKALAMIRAHRVKQHAEMTAFHEAQMEKRMTEAGATFEEKNVPQEKREEILKKMVAGMEERKAEAAARFDAMLAKLDALAAKTDLTKEDIRAALQDGRHKRDGKGPEGVEKKREGKGPEGKRQKPEKDDEGRNVRKAAPDA